MNAEQTMISKTMGRVYQMDIELNGKLKSSLAQATIN